MQQNKTNLVQLPLTTLGQETRWAYSTTLPSPHGAGKKREGTTWEGRDKRGEKGNHHPTTNS